MSPRAPLRAVWCLWVGAAGLAAASPIAAAAPALARQEASLSPAPGVSLLEVLTMTLEHDPNIAQVRSQLLGARGALLIAQGSFDPVLSSSANQSDTKTPLAGGVTEVNRTLQSTLDLSLLTRSGLSLEPNLTLSRVTDNTLGPGTSNAASVQFNIRQPLLRGRGEAVTAAAERAAAQSLAATALDLRHTISQRLLAVASQYWNLVAAVLDLEVLRASEASSHELLETTRKLVAADVTPAGELPQLEANLAAKEAARIGGERALFKARQDLAHEIGLEPAEAASLALPSSPLPEIAPEQVPGVGQSARFVALALAHRADLEAARRRLLAAESLLTAAGNAVAPQLDLLLTPSYNGFAAGTGAWSYWSPLYRNVPGASVSVGLKLSLPVGNRQALGALAQSQAAREQSALAVSAAIKGIGTDVPTALDAVGGSALELAKAKQAERLFEQTVVNQEKKLRAGSSTLIDVITQRDRLTAARQDQVSAQLNLAVALAQLRFATGTLLAGEARAEAASSAIDLERLTTLPTPLNVEEQAP